MLISKSVICEIDGRSDDGDQTLISLRGQMIKTLDGGDWPQDEKAYSHFFETYHECLFYILVDTRFRLLEGIRIGGTKTPDFRTRQVPIIHFEIKTIDFSGGPFAHRTVAEDGLDAHVQAMEEARNKGVGIGVSVVSPLGKASNSLEGVETVMKQIDGNIKFGQFESAQTFLVVWLVRSPVRTAKEEMAAIRHDDLYQGDVSGHLWTIAGHKVGEDFFDATDVNPTAHCLGQLQRDGILRDHPYIRGLLIMDAEWNKLGGTDRIDNSVFADAFRILGFWNPNYTKPDAAEDADETQVRNLFETLCDETIDVT